MTLFYWPLVLGILSAFLFFPLAAKERPSLSVITMVPLLDLEKKLIDNLDDYAKALDYKLELLRSHILDMRAENEKAQLEPLLYVSNPLNAFSLIRRLHRDWVGWRKFMEQPVGLVQMRQMNTWQSELPTKDDLYEACDGIDRIQAVYNLKVTDMIKGKLQDRQYNVKMSPSDILAVGNYLCDTSVLTAAAQWLKEVRPLSQKDLKTQRNNFFRPEKNVIAVVALMYMKDGYYPKALRLMNYWLQLFPHDARFERAILVLKSFMTSQPETDFERPTDLMIKDHQTIGLNYICSVELPKYRPSGQLRCSYNSSTTAFLRLAPLKMEQIGQDPYVVLYHDVLSSREISQLQKLEIDRIKISGVGVNPEHHRIRSCKVFQVSRELNRLTEGIKRRIEDMSGLDLADSELLQVVNYGIGGHYSFHTDFHKDPGNFGVSKLGDRIATVLFYLSDVERGGETVFPIPGYSVKPQAGTALFWYNLHTDGTGDDTTSHLACPVIVGSKWIMTQWIDDRKQLFKRPCLRPSPRE